MSGLGLLAAVALAATSSVALAPAAPRLGDLVVVRGGPAEVVPDEVQAFGYAFAARPLDGGWRAFVAVPVDAEPGRVPLRVVVDGAVVETATLTVVTRDLETSELRVRKKFTKKRKSPALRRRIRRESKAIARLWKRRPSASRALGAPVRPTTTAVTSPFGVARVFNGEVKSRHYGLDLDGKTGDPVAAVLPGKVVLSSMRFYSGGTLVLDHGGGLYTLYFHLARRRVRRGTTVRAGQRIGDVGRTGRVTGPHLHLAVAVRARWVDGPSAGKTRSMYVDPAALLARGAF